MKTALIAGASGYLGRYLSHELHRLGYKTRLLVRNPDKLKTVGKALSPPVADIADRVIVADITQPETLSGALEGVDLAISTVSLMAESSELTWDDVDYRGNLNLLREAERSGVSKFLYFSVFNAQTLSHVPMVDAHEKFVTELRRSQLTSTVVRPTGYFSDMASFFDMAKSGRVYLLGNGELEINPIHGQDLARASIEAVEGSVPKLSIGGPETLSWEQIARSALKASGKPEKITHIPLSLARAVVEIARPFVPSKAKLWDFFVSSSATSFVAPSCGEHQLADFFNDLQKLERKPVGKGQ